MQPGESLSRPASWEYLVAEIRALPEPMQQVMSMYYVDSMKFAEIAAVKGWNEKEVKACLDKAYMLLRPALRGTRADSRTEAT